MFIAANWKAYVEDAERAKKLFAVSKRLATRFAGKHGCVEVRLPPPLNALEYKCSF